MRSHRASTVLGREEHFAGVDVGESHGRLPHPDVAAADAVHAPVVARVRAAALAERRNLLPARQRGLPHANHRNHNHETTASAIATLDMLRQRVVPGAGGCADTAWSSLHRQGNMSSNRLTCNSQSNAAPCCNRTSEPHLTGMPCAQTVEPMPSLTCTHQRSEQLCMARRRRVSTPATTSWGLPRPRSRSRTAARCRSPI